MAERSPRRKLWGRVVSVRTGIFEAMNSASLVTPTESQAPDQADLHLLVSALPSPSDIVFVYTSSSQATMRQISKPPSIEDCAGRWEPAFSYISSNHSIVATSKCAFKSKLLAAVC